MRNSGVAICLAACLFLLSGCKPDSNQSKPNSDSSTETASGTNKNTVGAWMPPQNSPITAYPALSKGSPYAELLNAVVVDLGKPKNEFETTKDFNDRINNIPLKINERFGKIFAFRSMIPETRWNADTQTLEIVHTGEYRIKNHITLGVVPPVMYGLNVQGCAPNPSIKLGQDQAKSIKSGLADRSVRIFYVGTIDFSKRGWVSKETLLNHETIPGFHATGVQTADGATGLWNFDFDVARIDIVEASTGKIITSLKCSG